MVVLIKNILFFNFYEYKKSISQKFQKKYVYFSMLLYIKTNLKEVRHYYYLIGQVPYSYGPVVATGSKLGSQGVGV